jgi:bacterial/archaeal transporter family-2 protein
MPLCMRKGGATVTTYRQFSFAGGKFVDDGGKAGYPADMKWIYILFGLVAGMTMPVQAGVNLRLRESLGDPVFAAFVSFTVGAVVLGIYGFSLRPAPSMSMVSSAPWWSWTGGMLGAFFVFAIIVLAGQLGATSSMAWLLAGQFLAALVLDHFGLVSYAVHPVSWPRVAGVVLLIVGAMLINKY